MVEERRRKGRAQLSGDKDTRLFQEIHFMGKVTLNRVAQAVSLSRSNTRVRLTCASLYAAFMHFLRLLLSSVCI
jgi:hypothetical protein